MTQTIEELRERDHEKYDVIIRYIVEEKCPSPLILQRKFKITFEKAYFLMKTHSRIPFRTHVLE